MLSRLKSGVDWCGTQFKSTYQYLTSSKVKIFAHTTGEGFLAGQGTFYFIGSNLDALLKLKWNIDAAQNDELNFSYYSLGPALLLTLLAVYGAYFCHKANDEGNSPVVVNAFSTNGIQLLLKSDVIKTKHKLACLGERAAHSLGFAGAAEECLNLLVRSPSSTTQIVVGSVGFLWGLTASTSEVNNAIEGWIRLASYKKSLEPTFFSNSSKKASEEHLAN